MIRNQPVGLLARSALVAGLLALVACASDPPPPANTPSPPPPAPAAPVAEPAPDSPAPPATEETAAATPTEPECQAADDCTKTLGAAKAGHEWSCQDGHCAEHAAPEPPKPEETAAAPAKPAKAKNKGKSAGKKP